MGRVNIFFEKEQPIAERVYFFSVGLAILTMLFEPQWNNPFIFVLVISWFILRKEKGYLVTALKNPWVYFNLGLFGMYLLGMLYTQNLESGFSQIETKLGMLVFPFLLASSPPFSKKQKDLILMSEAILLSILAMVCLGFAFFNSYSETRSLFNLSEDWFVYNKLTSILSIQPIYFSLFILFVLIAGQIRIMELWTHMKRSEKISWVLLGIFLFVFLLLLSSRTSIITFFVWAFLWAGYLTFIKKKRATGIFLLGFELLLGYLMITGLDVNKIRFSEAVDLNSDYTTDRYAGRSLRIEKWKCAYKVWGSNPIFGVGTGDENAEMLKCFEAGNIEEAIRWQYNSHNQYLSTLVQVGGLGVLPLLAIILYPLFLGLKKKDFLIFSLGLVFLLCIGTETMLSRRWGVLFMTLILSVWFINGNSSPKEINDSLKRNK
jgi:O-antigen ligase